MSKQYTPSTENVRDDYIEGDLMNPGAGAAFDRWHQAELRKAKAEALRDVAGEFYRWIGLGAVDPVHPGDIARTLQIRADREEDQ